MPGNEEKKDKFVDEGIADCEESPTQHTGTANGVTESEFDDKDYVGLDVDTNLSRTDGKPKRVLATTKEGEIASGALGTGDKRIRFKDGKKTFEVKQLKNADYADFEEIAKKHSEDDASEFALETYGSRKDMAHSIDRTCTLPSALKAKWRRGDYGGTKLQTEVRKDFTNEEVPKEACKAFPRSSVYPEVGKNTNDITSCGGDRQLYYQSTHDKLHAKNPDFVKDWGTKSMKMPTAVKNSAGGRRWIDFTSMKELPDFKLDDKQKVYAKEEKDHYAFGLKTDQGVCNYKYSKYGSILPITERMWTGDTVESDIGADASKLRTTFVDCLRHAHDNYNLHHAGLEKITQICASAAESRYKDPALKTKTEAELLRMFSGILEKEGYRRKGEESSAPPKGSSTASAPSRASNSPRGSADSRGSTASTGSRASTNSTASRDSTASTTSTASTNSTAQSRASSTGTKSAPPASAAAPPMGRGRRNLPGSQMGSRTPVAAH